MSIRFTRRSLLQASAAGAARAALARPDSTAWRVPIHVGPGAGPPSHGAIAETSAPLPAGRFREANGFQILSPEGKPVLAQMRAASRRPDGSIRWLAVAFEAESGPGTYTLAEGHGPEAPPLSVDRNTALAFDLVLTRHDGELFRSSAGLPSRRTVVEETGPVRSVVRLEGSCLSARGERLFDYVARITAFRLRPELLLSITWINNTTRDAEQLRDIRLVLPLASTPDRLVFGCDNQVYDAPQAPDWPVFVLQDDHNRYWAKTVNPDGRVQHLASGGANGEHCPGWLYATGPQGGAGVAMANFWEEFPSELALAGRELSVGFWPERAAHALAAKPVLPRSPFGGRPYSNTRYWPVMPHPYVAFFDAEKKCLDVPQGVAKTQDLLVSTWTAGEDGSAFESRHWARSLWPVRGHADPAAVAASGVVGPLLPRTPAGYPDFERLYDECHGWFDRHAKQARAWGKFDYGDFRYFHAATDYLCGPGTKWGKMGEMPREGYWHNNERDTLRGLLLYYLRTGSPAAWDLVRRAARHLYDVDIRHHPHWGMYTHSYGHCYLALGEGGDPDHSWLTGMLEWAELTGDPVAMDNALRCADQLAQWKVDFALTDTRSVSVFVHALCQFHAHTGQARYLEAARPAAAVLVRLQNSDGGWPAYLADMDKPRAEGFVEHALIALADYYTITRASDVRAVIDRGFEHLFPAGKDWRADPGESPLALHALGVMADVTGEDRYARTASELLTKLYRQLDIASPDPLSRGDLWAEWGVNNAGHPPVPGRPPQLLGQTRPLSPSTILAYGQQCLALIARRGK